MAIEWPDLTGMDRFTPRLAPKEALELNDQFMELYPLYPLTPQQAKRRLAERPSVEFAL